MTKEEIIAHIRVKEDEWMQAWIMKDDAVFNTILSDDFLAYSTGDGFRTKEEWIGGAMGAQTCEAFYWKEVHVRVYGNTAVVTASVEQQAKVGEDDWSGLVLLTDVWVFQNGQWQVVSRHSTGPLAS
jgi:hypothetical protein